MFSSTIRPHRSSGFSTLEILIALAILVTVLTAIILLAFGTQSVRADSQTDGEALSIAQSMIEQEQALARQDFKLVNSTAVTNDGIYTKYVVVQTQPDYLTKKVIATVSWAGDHNRSQSVSLTTLVTNFANATTSDTCDSNLSGDWSNPQVKNVPFDFGMTIQDGGSTYPITDIDAYQGKLYVTTNNPSVNQNTFFVLDISNPANITLVPGDALDNDPNHNTGLNAVQVSGDYAYVANASGLTTGQLQIINIHDVPAHVIASYRVPGVTGSGGQALGNALFYQDGYVYLGLTKTGSGPEFSIVDVHDPQNPFLVSGSQYAIGHDVNAITVRNGYAYVAHPASSGDGHPEQVTVLDVSDPTHVHYVDGFSAGDFSGNGKSLYTVGNTLYLGRTVASGKELAALDITTPSAIPATPLSSAEVGDSVNGVIVRDILLFDVTNSRLEVRPLAGLTAVTGSVLLPGLSGSGPYSSYEPALDCEGNEMIVSYNDVNNRGSIAIIAP